ncbi:hypothetical protein [Faunimonas pinastri]|nr:hypothetical protein [Faunimonas pinastri]
MDPMNTGAHEQIDPSEFDSIDAILSDLEVEDQNDGEIIEEIEDLGEPELTATTEEAVEETTPVAAGDEVLDDDALGELEASITRAEIYEEQQSDAAVEVEAAEASIAAAVPPARAARAPSTPKTPRPTRDLNSLPPEAFILTADVPEDLEANKKEVLAKRPLQKKVAEKFDNLILSLAADREPSTFIMSCYSVLDAKGEVTSSDLVAALRTMSSNRGTTYNEGTARSQVGQIMALFDVTKIATRAGKVLKLNPDSLYGQALKLLLDGGKGYAEEDEEEAA